MKDISLKATSRFAGPVGVSGEVGLTDELALGADVPFGLGPSLGRGGGVWLCKYSCIFMPFGKCWKCPAPVARPPLTEEDRQDLIEMGSNEMQYYQYNEEWILRSYQDWKRNQQEPPRYQLW